MVSLASTSGQSDCLSICRAVEMAKEFSHTNVTGVDLVPVPLDTAAVPQNMRMEVDDINLGLPHFHGQFDLVHLRCVTSGIRGTSGLCHS